jgi:hypothetical protein
MIGGNRRGLLNVSIQDYQEKQLGYAPEGHPRNGFLCALYDSLATFAAQSFSPSKVAKYAKEIAHLTNVNP